MFVIVQFVSQLNTGNKMNTQAMQILVRDKIHEEVYGRILPPGRPAKWRIDVLNNLRLLEPNIPEDNSVGYIAFNNNGKARTKLRVGRFLTRKLNLNSGLLNDQQIRNIADAINDVLYPDIKVELLKGEGITKAYEKGVGCHSCMTDGNAIFTRMYEDNPDRFQLLVMRWQNDSARALLYKLDNGQQFISTIYHSCSVLREKMVNYAEKQGWYDVSSKDKIVSNLNWEDGHVPFQDILQCYKIEKNGKLTIFYDSSCGIKSEGCLDSTEGYIYSKYICYSCDNPIAPDEHYNVADGTYCDACYNEIFCMCDNCGTTVDRDRGITITDIDGYVVCEYCARHHYNQCQECDKHFEGDLEDNYCLECLPEYIKNK